MEVIWDRYYGITKRFLSLSGQWPYQNKNEKMLRMSVVTTAILVINLPQIKILTDRVSIDWKRLHTLEEHEIMETYVTGTRWIVLMYIVVCLIGLHVFILMSLIPHILDIVLPLNESRPIMLPFEAYYFVDERKYFFYILCSGLISADIGMFAFIAYDIMFFTFVEHACGIFAVTGFRFEHLVSGDINAVKIFNNNTDETYNKRISCSLDTHRAALEFAEHLENTFSLNLGIELLLATVILSINLLQVTKPSHNIVEILRHFNYVLGQVIHLFVFCWEGQRLMDHSLQIHYKVMELIWDRYYSFTKRFLSLSGQWPYQNKNERMLRLSIITTAILVINVPQIKILTDRVSIDWKRLQNQEEHEIMETYVTSARRLILMYTAVCLIGLHIFILVSLIPHILDIVLPLNESRPIVLPFEAYYFVDERKYFIYIFCYGLIAAEITVVGLIAYDIMFFTFVEHVCGIFAVTGFRFEHLVSEDIDAVKVVNNDTDKTYNKKMACSVDAHRAALE
ncbi:PREDICTED: uncharacterized protein LOC106749534 [Dinoponera quadriceps]|uniref:Uncharacterized protein LOC106749534 n=1 Tax=Dinoponera quadriceps TaxID=609295 RepID=A0A6P3Y170_DINQU|nr:PREDICTED: uncharacterized protein LOC106749534 [Dinoponera quadriceps]